MLCVSYLRLYVKYDYDVIRSHLAPAPLYNDTNLLESTIKVRVQYTVVVEQSKRRLWLESITKSPRVGV